MGRLAALINLIFYVRKESRLQLLTDYNDMGRLELRLVLVRELERLQCINYFNTPSPNYRRLSSR